MTNNGGGLPLRILRGGLNLMPHRAPVQERAIDVIKDLTDGLDAEDMAYFMNKGKNITLLFPQRFVGYALSYIASNGDVLELSTEALLVAAAKARPDCADIWRTPQAGEWLRNIFTITF